MAEDSALEMLTEIRNWIRAANFASVHALLESELPDPQSRTAYQMLDGKASMEQVRIASKMSPNRLVALTQRWTSRGLMEVVEDKKKKRIFDLSDFGLINTKD